MNELKPDDCLDREIAKAFAAATASKAKIDQERFMEVLIGLREPLVSILRNRWEFPRADAEDGVSGMLADVWECLAADKLSPPRRSWFSRLLYWARGHAGWRNRKRRSPIIYAELEESPPPAICPKPTPDQEVEAREMFLHLVTMAARRWTEMEKRVFWGWAQGLNHAEITQTLKLCRGSSRVLLTRALQAIRSVEPNLVSTRGSKAA